MVVGDDAMAKQAQRARQAIAEDGRTDVADVHRLGDVGGTEINDDRPGRRGRLKKQMFTARRGFERLREGGIFEMEIQEAGAGNFHRLANFSNVQFCQHVGGQLARIHFARLGQRHERVGLVIAKFRVGTGTDQNGGDIGVRQDGADGGLEL